MKFITALFTHASLAMRLKHDGTGMPIEVPAALMLACLYIALNLVNHNHVDGIPLDIFIKVGFVAQCYILFLRNKLVGLIILISVISNVLILCLTTVAGIPKENLNLLLFMEYIMMTAAIINVIKSETKVI